MINRKILSLLGSLILVGLLAACRGNTEVIPPEAAGIQISLSVAPSPPQVGNATLVVSLRDQDGEPVEEAVVNVVGDMDMAGMQPVNGESRTAIDGDYNIPFEWTMGGDWFVDVTVELPGNVVVEERFDFTVQAGPDLDLQVTEPMNEVEVGDPTPDNTELAATPVDDITDGEVDVDNDN